MYVICGIWCWTVRVLTWNSRITYGNLNLNWNQALRQKTTITTSSESRALDLPASQGVSFAVLSPPAERYSHLLNTSASRPVVQVVFQCDHYVVSGVYTYLPCQLGYFFGKVVEHAPGMQGFGVRVILPAQLYPLSGLHLATVHNSWLIKRRFSR